MWVEPNLADLQRKLQQVYQDQSGRERKAQRAKRWIETHLTWEAAADVAAARLNNLMSSSV